MDGLTYDTKSQAEIQVKDAKAKGIFATVKPTSDGKWKVFYGIGSKTYEASEKGILRETPEDLLQLEKEEKIRGWEQEAEDDALESRIRAMNPSTVAAKKLSLKKQRLEKDVYLASRQGEDLTVEEIIDPATGEVKDYELRELPPSLENLLAKEKGILVEKEKKLESWGIDPGKITPIRDPKTGKISGYKRTYPEGRPGTKKIKKGLTEAPLSITKAGEGIISQTSRSIDVKKGMMASIPGQQNVPKASIAWLPEKDEGYIGARRPAIGKTGQADVSKVGKNYMESPDTLANSPVSNLPKAKKLTVNEQQDAGFAITPMLRKPKKED